MKMSRVMVTVLFIAFILMACSPSERSAGTYHGHCTFGDTVGCNATCQVIEVDKDHVDMHLSFDNHPDKNFYNVMLIVPPSSSSELLILHYDATGNLYGGIDRKQLGLTYFGQPDSIYFVGERE